MKRLFVYRGKKIHLSHQSLLIRHGILMTLPFMIGLGFFHFYYTYPMVKDLEGEWMIESFIFPILLTILVILFANFISVHIIKTSILRGGFFAREEKKQILARYLKDNEMVIRKKQSEGRETCKFPPVYYHPKKDVDEFTFRIGNKFHDKFLVMGKPLEEIFMADLVEIEKTPQHITFKLLVDMISKRLNFLNVTVDKGVVQLMKGVEWNFDELPHMLITGGTGGGKTYFIYMLIAVLGREGRIHVADPKKSDLSDLAEFPTFQGLVFSETSDIFDMLKKSVELMDKRFKYMKEHPKHKMGKNYRYYEMPPEFFIIDEWGAFVSTLSMREEMELYQMISPLVLKARQAGVFLIVATQKAGTDVIKSMIRDNLMCKVSLGALSPTGYEMTFGGESKNKTFYNKTKVKGRGYIDVGNGIPQEFYAPWVERDFSFEKYFSEMPKMPYCDVSAIKVSEEEKETLENEFVVQQSADEKIKQPKKRESGQNYYRTQEQKHK